MSIGMLSCMYRYAFCTASSRLEVSEQALDRTPLHVDLGLVKINLANLHNA